MPSLCPRSHGLGRKPPGHPLDHIPVAGLLLLPIRHRAWAPRRRTRYRARSSRAFVSVSHVAITNTSRCFAATTDASHYTPRFAIHNLKPSPVAASVADISTGILPAFFTSVSLPPLQVYSANTTHELCTPVISQTFFTNNTNSIDVPAEILWSKPGSPARRSSNHTSYGTSLEEHGRKRQVLTESVGDLTSFSNLRLTPPSICQGTCITYCT